MKSAVPSSAASLVTPEDHLSRRARLLQVSIGVGALLTGVLVYIVDRSPDSVYFVPSWLSLSGHFNQVFGIIGNYLPTFVHPLAFILLTSALVESNKQNILYISLAWLVVDCLFEFSQMRMMAQWLVTFIPAFDGVPILENTRNYFIHGTFDVWDVMSIISGTATAYFIARKIQSLKCE